MAYFITYKQRGNLLVKYKVDSATGDELKAIPQQAHEEFRK